MEIKKFLSLFFIPFLFARLQPEADPPCCVAEKPRPTFLIIFLFFFFTSAFNLQPSALYGGEHSKLLMGSVVRSKTWKIDRKNNTEIFEGNVSLHGSDYDISCEHAIYYRNRKYWQMKDNVILTKFFDRERRIDAYGDYAEYFEENKEMRINGIKNQIRADYKQPPDTSISAKSNKLVFDANESIATFYEDFSIIKDNIRAYSGNAVYNQKEGSFLLFDSSPSIIGQYTDYNFAIKGEKIKIIENAGTMTVTGNVHGIIKK